MPVDPQLVELLRRVDEAPPMSSHSPEKARELFRRLNLLAAGAAQKTEVGAVEDIEVPGGAGPRPARVYTPKGRGPHPTLAFFHGGGFTIGDLDSYDMQCRVLCDQVGVVVVSTDYRLAPEDPHPAAVEDAVAATRWIADHFERPLAVGGDSAGGNLSAVVAQQLRGNGPPIAAQLLIYPATDLVSDRPSHEENGRGYFLTRDDMEWFHANYLPSRDAGLDPLASPIFAHDLSGLPPAVLVTAEYDPLRDDGDAYAEALEGAGVRVIHRRFDSLVHGFFGFGPFSTTCESAIRQVCADLRELLGSASR
jgi:acetyl esterase